MRLIFFFCFFYLPLLSVCQERIEFLSKNPFSFKDIITNLENQQNQEVYGILRWPKNHFKNSENICPPDSIFKVPLIIAVAGSNGWASHHYEYLEMYRENGIATFELCSFQSRGVVSTVGSQIKVTTAMMGLDSYRALEKLSKNVFIDNERVGIMGWSLGGGVTLFSAWEPLKKSIESQYSFSAHLALYPPCIVQPTNLNFGEVPIHILIGEHDNWTPAEACVELVNGFSSPKNIGLTIYPGAHHSFDRNSSIEINKNGYILEDCRFTLMDNGTVVTNFLNIPISTPFLQKIGVGLCAKRGPAYGGNIKAKTSALDFAQIFMTTHLKNE